jgi:flagellar hook-basal body complex protein FliE
MTIPAIGAIASALPALPAIATPAIASPAIASPASIAPGGTGGASPGADFAAVLGKGLNAVQSAQSSADTLAVQAATGDLTDIHNYTIAATQASLMTELATTIRTKGVDAFNQIMGMQA